MSRRLVDYFMVVGINPDDPSIDCENVEPVILDRYPEKDWEDTEMPVSIAMFCVPLGMEIAPMSLEQRSPNIFSFSLTGGEGLRSYGVALQYYETYGKIEEDEKDKQLYVPKSFCILSHFPFFSFFSHFLREVYRKCIEGNTDSSSTEDRSSEVTMFFSNLRRASVRVDPELLKVLESNQPIDFPIECNIANLINGTPPISPGSLVKFPFGPRTLEFIYPPTSTFPLMDDDCFTILCRCLSSEHILQIFRFLLLQQKMLFYSNHVDKLTMCTEALLSLLFPFQWVLSYVPLLPLDLTECLDSPTPYVMGISTQALDYTKEIDDRVILVHLDMDEVNIPKELLKKQPDFPSSLSKKLLNSLKSIVPKPAVKIVHESEDGKYLVYDVTFGPGPLGTELTNDKGILDEGDTEEKNLLVVKGFRRVDEGQMSQGEKCGCIRVGSIVIGLNNKSVVNKPLSEILTDIKTLPRPLIIRFQYGIKPKKSLSLSSKFSQESPLEENPTLRRKNSIVKEDSKKFSENIEGNNWVEEMRFTCVDFIANLLGNYRKFILPEVDYSSLPFDTKSYLSSLPHGAKNFMKVFCETQMFSCFISDHLNDPPDPYLDILKHIIEINCDESVKKRYQQSLSRRFWNLNEFKVEEIKIKDIEHLYSTEDISRQTGVFPKFNYKLFQCITSSKFVENEFVSIRRPRQVSGTFANDLMIGDSHSHMILSPSNIGKTTKEINRRHVKDPNSKSTFTKFKSLFSKDSSTSNTVKTPPTPPPPKITSSTRGRHTLKSEALIKSKDSVIKEEKNEADDKEKEKIDNNNNEKNENQAEKDANSFPPPPVQPLQPVQPIDNNPPVSLPPNIPPPPPVLTVGPAEKKSFFKGLFKKK